LHVVSNELNGVHLLLAGHHLAYLRGDLIRGLQGGKLGHLGDEVLVIHRIERVLVLQLHHEKLEEVLLTEPRGLSRDAARYWSAGAGYRSHGHSDLLSS